MIEAEIRVTKEGRGFWALAFVGSKVFRQHGWTEDDARTKVGADILRERQKGLSSGRAAD